MTAGNDSELDSNDEQAKTIGLDVEPADEMVIDRTVTCFSAVPTPRPCLIQCPLLTPGGIATTQAVKIRGKLF